MTTKSPATTPKENRPLKLTAAAAFAAMVTCNTLANITTWLMSIDWDGWGFSDAFWTQALLAAGALIALAVFEKFRDATYLPVIIWAYFGILAKYLLGGGFDERYTQVVTLLSLLISALGYRVALQMVHHTHH